MLSTNLVSGAALLCLIPGLSAINIDIGAYLPSAILTRDVAIIGGGSSGTYAAVQLKRAGKTVALVEKEAQLGGHVDTYKDPQTGKTFDYGVVVYLNTSTVRNYVTSLGESLTAFPFFTGTNAYADFKGTGQFLNLPAPDQAATFAALQGYRTEISKYPFLDNGYNLPSPVPADLLLPFGDFLTKYNLQLFAPTAFKINQGVGNLLAATTLYMLKYLPKTTIDAFLGLAPPVVTSSTFNFQALYNKAQAYLTPSSALVSSNVLAISRVGPRVLVAITTPTGPKLIIAKKLLIAIQPKLSSLQALNIDLAPSETQIFTQFNNSYYWDVVIKNSGLPANTDITNVDPAAPMGIPPLPGLYGFSTPPIGNNHITTWYGSPYPLTDAQVKANVLATVNKLVTANNLASPPPTPQIVGFNSHNPFWLSVPPATIASGFYNQLNALQGKKNTFWTGATFASHDSSAIWEWSETELLPQLKASL